VHSSSSIRSVPRSTCSKRISRMTTNERLNVASAKMDECGDIRADKTCRQYCINTSELRLSFSFAEHIIVHIIRRESVPVALNDGRLAASVLFSLPFSHRINDSTSRRRRV
jgi:hypothetical protein